MRLIWPSAFRIFRGKTVIWNAVPAFTRPSRIWLTDKCFSGFNPPPPLSLFPRPCLYSNVPTTAPNRIPPTKREENRQNDGNDGISSFHTLSGYSGRPLFFPVASIFDLWSLMLVLNYDSCSLAVMGGGGECDIEIFPFLNLISSPLPVFWSTNYTANSNHHIAVTGL